MARIVQLSAELESKRIAEKIRYIEQHVPYGIVNQEFYDNIEKAKEPLVKIYHYHCNHLGTPQELSDEKGDIIWLSYDRAWGGSFDSLYKQQFVDNFAVKENELQPFKFQGQLLDIETDLHYNRFRYYDSDVGMFVQRDPIGLMGGDNVFAYAPNPTDWIDPFGLSNRTNRSSKKKAVNSCTIVPPSDAPKRTQPHSSVVNALDDFKTQRYQFGSNTYQLDKAGMTHILKRHHPEFWNGSLKGEQSFFCAKVAIAEIQEKIKSILEANRELLSKNGQNAKYFQLPLTPDGYQVGLNNGRIGQFYKK